MEGDMRALLLVSGLLLAGSSSAAKAEKQMIFGGEGHRDYLGCLNFSEFDPDSIWNKFGEYGNPFGNNLFNQFSPYRNPFSQYSMCNRYATDPPVVVDGDGNFYGRLTLNKARGDRIKDPKIVGWIAGVCSA
jgi:hypothetical protein